MKSKLSSSISAAKRVSYKAKDIALKANKSLPVSRSSEIKLSATGGVVGAIGGAALIGGMGVALLGTAVAVSGAAVVGIAGVAIGNKIGSEIDRRKAGKYARDLD